MPLCALCQFFIVDQQLLIGNRQKSLNIKILSYIHTHTHSRTHAHAHTHTHTHTLTQIMQNTIFMRNKFFADSVNLSCRS